MTYHHGIWKAKIPNAQRVIGYLKATALNTIRREIPELTEAVDRRLGKYSVSEDWVSLVTAMRQQRWRRRDVN